MTRPAEAPHSGPESGERPAAQAGSAVRLVRAADGQDTGSPGRSRTTSRAGTAVGDRPPAGPDHGRSVRSWPLLVRALPATAVAWSGWAGTGQMTGFGQVCPMPGIWGSFHPGTALTLPAGVETYAACALRAWLSPSRTLSSWTCRFARWPAAGSLLGWPGRSPATSSPKPASPMRRGASPPRCPACSSWFPAWPPPSPA